MSTKIHVEIQTDLDIKKMNSLYKSDYQIKYVQNLVKLEL